MCLISIKVFIVRSILYVTVPNSYNNNYNNNCLFDILLTQLFAILLTTEIFEPRTSHKADCFVLPFYMRTSSV